MKRYLWILMLIAAHLDGYMSGSSSSSSSTFPSPTPAKPKPKLHKPNLNTPSTARPSQTAELPPKGPLYYYPGMVWLKNGRWIGSDNFTNISKAISLQIDLVKPADLVSPITQEAIRSKIISIFTAAGISIVQGAGEGSTPPLPLFEMQVMIFPVKDGYAAALFSHLLEDAPPARLQLGEGELFQSITWQQANLVVGQTEEIVKLSLDTVEEIANAFVKRLATYQTPTTRGGAPAEENLPAEK